jgi:hypothetical protein
MALPPTARRKGSVSVTRRQHRAESRYSAAAGPKSCHGARRVWRGFWHPGTNYNEGYECRGTNFIGAVKLSPVTKLVVGTGAVSRYKLSRSQKSVTVQDLNCEHMCVSGYMNHYKFVVGAGAIKNRDKLIDPTVRVRHRLLI